MQTIKNERTHRLEQRFAGLEVDAQASPLDVEKFDVNERFTSIGGGHIEQCHEVIWIAPVSSI